MKRCFLFTVCLSVVAAFAGPRDIKEFSAQDVGTPDDYIVAEFGGELKVAPASEVTTLQKGRLVVRQKFEDPFGEAETTYQLYQGSVGDLSSISAFEVPSGTSYQDVIKAKIYTSSSDEPEQDVEKVYFDGKNIFVPGVSTAFAFVKGKPVELKGVSIAEEAPAEEPEEEVAAVPEEEEEVAAAPEAPAVPETESSKGNECDEYDPDCEDDDESYDVAGDITTTNRNADAADYAADEASSDITSRFGIADEVRFWSAIALSALAATSIVMGVIQHMEANKAGDAYDELNEYHKNVFETITNVCSEKLPGDQQNCIAAMSNYNLNESSKEAYTLNTLEARMDKNKKTRDSYSSARNIWFGVAGASITGAIVLFVW